jgi:hypothetical protein
MMEEELPAKKEERKIVDGPNEEEKSSIIPKAISNSCITQTH